MNDLLTKKCEENVSVRADGIAIIMFRKSYIILTKIKQLFRYITKLVYAKQNDSKGK